MSNRLNLIDYYYQYLFKEDVLEATFCFLDRDFDQYNNKELMRIFSDEEDIKVCHLKMPRVFEKEYPFEKINNTILEFILENPDVDTIMYQDLTDDIFDPFYHKPIKNIKCDYIHFIRFYDDERLKIVLIAYSNKSILDLKVSTIKTLNKKLIANEEDEIINELNKLIVENSRNYYLYNDNTDEMYFSDSLQDVMHIKRYYNRNNKKGVYDDVNTEVNRLIRTSKVVDCSIRDVKAYFFTEIRKSNNKIYSLYDLEINKKNVDLTIIYLENKSFVNWNFTMLLNNLNKILKTMLIQDYQFYQISDSELYIIIENLIEQRILEKVSSKIISLNDNNLDLDVLYLNTAYNISLNNLNFLTLSKYLKYAINNGETKFSMNNYKRYVRLLSEAKYFSEEIIGQESIHKKVIDSVTLETVGAYLGYYHLELEKIQRETFYHHASEYICKRASELSGDKLYFRIHYGEFSNKKIWYNLRRITNFEECYIILSEIEISTEIGLKKFISDIDRLHVLGFKVFVDSSIYASIMMNDIVSHFEGIYVEDYEMSIGDTENDSLFKAVLTFYLKENKMILLHQIHNYYQFKDQNILYINEIIKPQED